jgi:phosphate transport system substrate-binding protein
MRKASASALVMSAVSAVALLGACKGSGDSKGSTASSTSSNAAIQPTDSTISLNGAGATFPFPLYSKWIAEYGKANPKVKVNYQSVGSGAGIKQISDRTVDFGGSDAPMNDEQLGKAPGKIVHIPTTLGAVVVTYNLPDVKSPLKVSSEVIAGMFLGEIKKWNDPKLVALNPDAKLPATPVTIVHRSDGSGTSAVFTDYLAKTSPAWKEKVGSGTSVAWPTGVGGKGNEGVTGSIKTTPGSLGYVELVYAKQTNLPTMAIKNAAGKFVDPSLESVSSAASGVAATIPDDLRVSITNAPGDGAYPIAAFTYALVYADGQSVAKSEAVAKFLWWGIHDGQAFSEPLHYAKLPPEIVTKAEAKLKSLKAEGKPLL